MSHQITQETNIESDVTLLGQSCRIRGDIILDRFSRVHGAIEGKIKGLDGSLLVIADNATVHGEIDGCEIIIDGFVRGNVRATRKVTVSETGTLIGDIYSPLVSIKFGAFFEGQAITENGPGTTQPSAENPAAN